TVDGRQSTGPPTEYRLPPTVNRQPSTVHRPPRVTSPASGFLDFFILEASEYVEQLDGLLARASATSSPVDAEALGRNARALRGSATMAKVPPFAELALSLERIGRGLREGAIAWSPALSGALVAAIDDLKILIRSVRGWSPADAPRASARAGGR